MTGKRFYKLQVDKYVKRPEGGLRQVTVQRRDFRTKEAAVRAARSAHRRGLRAVVYVERRGENGGSINEGIAWP